MQHETIGSKERACPQLDQPRNWINDPNGPFRDPKTGVIHLWMHLGNANSKYAYSILILHSKALHASPMRQCEAIS